MKDWHYFHIILCNINLFLVACILCLNINSVDFPILPPSMPTPAPALPTSRLLPHTLADHWFLRMFMSYWSQYMFMHTALSHSSLSLFTRVFITCWEASINSNANLLSLVPLSPIKFRQSYNIFCSSVCPQPITQSLSTWKSLMH